MKPSLEKILKFVSNRKKFLLLLAPALVLLILKPIFLVLGLFIAIGSLSTIYKSRINVGLDLELQSFFTIAAGMIYGPQAGLIVGFLSVIIGHSLNLMFFSNPILSTIYASSFAFLGMISASTPIGIIVLVAVAYIIANDIIFVLLGTMMGANTGRLIVTAILHPIYVFIIYSRLLVPFVRVARG